MADGSVGECPNCGFKWTFQSGEKPYNFCPYDGTELVSPEKAERQRQVAERQVGLPMEEVQGTAAFASQPLHGD